MKKINIIISMFVVGLLLSSCATNIVETSNEVITKCRPDWVDKPPRGTYASLGKADSETSARILSRSRTQNGMAQAMATQMAGFEENQIAIENAQTTEDVFVQDLKATVNTVLKYAQVKETKTCKLEGSEAYTVYTLMEYDTKTAKSRLKAEEALAKELDMELQSMSTKNLTLDDLLKQMEKITSAE